MYITYTDMNVCMCVGRYPSTLAPSFILFLKKKFPTGIGDTVPHRLLLQAGSNTTYYDYQASPSSFHHLITRTPAPVP
jgi:hypothetical protein